MMPSALMDVLEVVTMAPTWLHPVLKWQIGDARVADRANTTMAPLDLAATAAKKATSCSSFDLMSSKRDQRILIPLKTNRGQINRMSDRQRG